MSLSIHKHWTASSVSLTENSSSLLRQLKWCPRRPTNSVWSHADVCTVLLPGIVLRVAFQSRQLPLDNIFVRCRPSAGDTVSPAYNVWSSGLFSSRSDVLELTAQKLAWPVTYCCCFWTMHLKHFFFQSTSVHSASEAFATMRYINWCFTYLLTLLTKSLNKFTVKNNSN